MAGTADNFAGAVRSYHRRRAAFLDKGQATHMVRSSWVLMPGLAFLILALAWSGVISWALAATVAALVVVMWVAYVETVRR